jgi:hypothetical protein
VIEFQKRGLPHAHILVILEKGDRILTEDEIDAVVCAELPVKPTRAEYGPAHAGTAEFEQATERFTRLRDLLCANMSHREHTNSSTVPPPPPPQPAEPGTAYNRRGAVGSKPHTQQHIARDRITR